MKIKTQQLYDCSWFASDEDYDGAPDAGRQKIGTGNTELEALQDYIDTCIEMAE